MNKSGRQNENNERIREIIGDKIQIQPGVFAIRDDLENIIVVDTNTGITYEYVNNNLIECNTGDKSRKSNGYVYTELMLIIDGELKKINYGTHSLVAMISHTWEYDRIVNTGKTPVVNHLNNIPWDNREENLEWTTQRLNTLHAKVIYSLYESERKSDWLKLFTEHRYTAVRFNQNIDSEHITLLVGLSTKDIELYEEYIKINKKKSLKEYWGLKEKEDLIHQYKLKEFLEWLEAHNRPLYF